jgi:hypothetical protein
MGEKDTIPLLTSNLKQSHQYSSNAFKLQDHILPTKPQANRNRNIVKEEFYSPKFPKYYACLTDRFPMWAPSPESSSSSSTEFHEFHIRAPPPPPLISEIYLGSS